VRHEGSDFSPRLASIAPSSGLLLPLFGKGGTGATRSRDERTMRSSRSRFFLLRVILPAALLNAVINGILGAAVFPAGHDVALLGIRSVGADTLVGSFLMGFLTFIGVAPPARMEARSGRVRGFGGRGSWLAWPTKHPLLSAAGLGVLWVALFGVPAMKELLADGALTMPRGEFLAFKVEYATVFGVLAAIVSALIGLAPEVRVPDDLRWCPDPSARVEGPVYAFDSTDKMALAAGLARGCSGAPTWDLHVRGALDPAHVRRALVDLVTRYPSLATKVQSLDGVPPVAAKYRYAHDGSFHVDAIFEVVDARDDPARAFELTRELRDRHTDLFADFPVALTMIETSKETCRLVFRQHEAIADGRAFIGLLVDFVAYLNAARAGTRPTAEALVPIGRRGEVEALRLSPLKQAAYTIGGAVSLLRSSWRDVVHPVTPLLQNRSSEHSGENRTVHWVVGNEALGVWNSARDRLDVGLNALLTGALMVANQRMHRARGLSLGRTVAELPMETRPRGAGFVSFANHVAFLEVEADLGASLDSAALVRSIQAQETHQRDHGVPFKRLLIQRIGILLLPLEQIQRVVRETRRPRSNLSFSNLIALEFPTLEGDGWRVEDVFVTTPAAWRHGVTLNVIRYSGKLVFNFNYNSTAVTREQAEELSGHFREVLGELPGGEI
jgi:hypothetical protein